MAGYHPAMDLNLRGKSAVVTGASRGLGRAIAESLAAEGCRLTICARGEQALDAAAQQLTDDHDVEVLALPMDLTGDGEADRLVNSALERFGRVDVLVNNVGGNRRGGVDELSDDDWREMIDLNFQCHVRTTRAVVPSMKARGSGAILFVASIFGREVGGPGLAIYDSTKSALISLAKTLALDLAPHGIRVNSIAPGSIRFPGGSWDKRCREDPEAMKEFVGANIPMGRFGRADEIGDVAAFLCSDRASWITGACVNVDGGQSRSLI